MTTDHQKHEKIYRRVGLLFAVMLLPFGAMKAVTWAMAYGNVFRAAEALCENVMAQGGGKRPNIPLGPGVGHGALVQLSDESYSLRGMVTTLAELPRHIGIGSTRIEDGSFWYNTEVRPEPGIGSYYPALTVPQHCAYSITELSWPLEVHVWLWGQRQVHWRQEFVGTPPVFELGAPYASHCFMRAHFNWWHWRIDFGQGYGSCGRDEKVDPTAPNHAEQVERLQGRHLGWGKRYREYVVR